MTRSKLNQFDAAALIGIPYAVFNKFVLGVRRPGLTNAVKIEQKTGIPVEAWASIRADKSLPSATSGNRNS
jgi:hypothetical protein